MKSKEKCPSCDREGSVNEYILHSRECEVKAATPGLRDEVVRKRRDLLTKAGRELDTLLNSQVNVNTKRRADEDSFSTFKVRVVGALGSTADVRSASRVDQPVPGPAKRSPGLEVREIIHIQSDSRE